MAEMKTTAWIDGWRAAIEWLSEYGGPSGLAYAEEMRTRLPNDPSPLGAFND